MSYEDFLIREMTEPQNPEGELDVTESPGWGEDDLSGGTCAGSWKARRKASATHTGAETQAALTAHDCVHNHVKGRGSSPGSECELIPAEPGPPPMVCKRCGALTPPISPDSHRNGTHCQHCTDYLKEQRDKLLLDQTESATKWFDENASVWNGIPKLKWKDGGAYYGERKPTDNAFIEWLESHGDGLPLPEAFQEWLDRTEDKTNE